MKVIKTIMEDEDQGQEWGPFEWYHHPTTLDIHETSMGKTVYLSPTVPI